MIKSNLAEDFTNYFPADLVMVDAYKLEYEDIINLVSALQDALSTLLFNNE